MRSTRPRSRVISKLFSASEVIVKLTRGHTTQYYKSPIPETLSEATLTELCRHITLPLSESFSFRFYRKKFKQEGVGNELERGDLQVDEEEAMVVEEQEEVDDLEALDPSTNIYILCHYNLTSTKNTYKLAPRQLLP